MTVQELQKANDLTEKIKQQKELIGTIEQSSLLIFKNNYNDNQFAYYIHPKSVMSDLITNLKQELANYMRKELEDLEIELAEI